MSIFTTKDGTQIYYKDWGVGPPVVFSHGWPLNSDSWESQMVFLASHGYRCIAWSRMSCDEPPTRIRNSPGSTVHLCFSLS